MAAYLDDNVATIFFIYFYIFLYNYSYKYIIFVADNYNNTFINKNSKDMASIAQLVSEIAHSMKQPDSVPVRRAIKLGIIHARNEAIRRSYTNHNYTDKVLQQRFRLSVVDVVDGDIPNFHNPSIARIKRTANKVPRPVRLTNNLPFHSVRTAGVEHPIEIAYAKEAGANYYKHLPGMCETITYDYINGYIYINTLHNNIINNISFIIVESVFEIPHLIIPQNDKDNIDIDLIDDNDEFLLPEDMISTVKKIILETWNINVIRDTNESSSINIVK